MGHITLVAKHTPVPMGLDIYCNGLRTCMLHVTTWGSIIVT